MPAYIKPIRFEASAAHQGSSEYQIQASAKHAEHPVIQAEGSVIIQFSSKQVQFQPTLRFKWMDSEPFTVVSSVIFAPKKQLLALDLKTQQGLVIATKWNMDTKDNQETELDFSVNIPLVIEKSTQVIFRRKAIHVAINDVILPKSSPMKFKGFIDLDYEGKKAKCDLVWDTTRTQNNKLTAEVAIEGTLQHAVIE